MNRTLNFSILQNYNNILRGIWFLSLSARGIQSKKWYSVSTWHLQSLHILFSLVVLVYLSLSISKQWAEILNFVRATLSFTFEIAEVFFTFIRQTIFKIWIHIKLATITYSWNPFLPILIKNSKVLNVIKYNTCTLQLTLLLKCYWPLNNYSDLAHKTMHGY